MGIIGVALADNNSAKIIVSFDCDASTDVEDLVYLDSTANNKVLSLVDNAPPTPAIGFVISKTTATVAKVILLGEVTLPMARGHLFVGTNGKLSLTHSVPGYLQRMGFSYGNGKIYLNPDEQRVKRN